MTTWHADQELLDDYADGTTDHVLSASIEMHLMACSTCRARTARTVDTSRLDSIYASVVDRIDAPRSSVLERILGRLGVGQDTARLLVATPLLRASWLASVVAVLAFATAAAHAEARGLIVFLTIAPLAPVAGVATAFGLHRDPSHEITAATPYSAFRLLMIRAVAVLMTTAAGAAAVSPLLPAGHSGAWAWLLPALALTGLTRAAGAWVDPALAAGVIAGGWVGAIFTLHAQRVPVFGGAGQLIFLIIAVASAAEIHRSRDRLNLMRSAA